MSKISNSPLDIRDYVNNPLDYGRKFLNDIYEGSISYNLDTNLVEFEAIIISDSGADYGGNKTRKIVSEEKGELEFKSYDIRFVNSVDNDNTPLPDLIYPNPLGEKTKEDFIKTRDTNNVRAVKATNSYFGYDFAEIPIGYSVTVKRNNDVFFIVDSNGKEHPFWTKFIEELGQSSTSSQKPFNNAAPGAHSNSPYSSQRKSSTVSKGGVPETIANPASNCEVPIEARALLDMIAYNESRGSYNIRYGGNQAIEITDFSDHPRKAERITRGYNTGKKSSAAGRYQFITSTWDDIAKQEGITDFTPESQDRAAYALAIRDYEARNPGRDLLKDLKSGTPEDLNRIGRSLSQTWTSLPGSTSGEQLTSDSQFVEGYNNLLKNQKELNNCKKSLA